jgi:hypothetical protein
VWYGDIHGWYRWYMDIIGKFVSMKKWKTSCMKKWYSREKITIPTIIFF